ncbi:MAG: SagB/ThcOx family dehydrogenase [Planctomycetes bacterium]|nr:SagB/ThcOx family dehydrogenase [Planctomycetota bacterium]MBL7189493.1 SagB/ThcOx family dehydrogenase [Phycisphaerae bacterium]
MKAVSATIILSIFITCCIGSLSWAESLQSIQLVPPDTNSGIPLMKALNHRMSTKAFAAKTIPLEKLSNLLWAAFGINRKDSGNRTVATAMNCQDTDIYVVLKKGVYVYKAKEHTLVPVLDQDVRSLAATQEYAQVAPINLIYVSDYAKIADRFQAKKPSYAAFHAGAISQNVYLYCAFEGLGTVVRDSVDRTKLRDVLKLRKDQVIVMGQSVGYPQQAPTQ